jgi:hypothetical protein
LQWEERPGQVLQLCAKAVAESASQRCVPHHWRAAHAPRRFKAARSAPFVRRAPPGESRRRRAPKARRTGQSPPSPRATPCRWPSSTAEPRRARRAGGHRRGHIAHGLPRITLVGLADTEVKEARERVHAALIHSGLEFRTTSASRSTWRRPTCRRSRALRSAHRARHPRRQRPDRRRATRGYEFAGELSLAGELRPVRGRSRWRWRCAATASRAPSCCRGERRAKPRWSRADDPRGGASAGRRAGAAPRRRAAPSPRRAPAAGRPAPSRTCAT